MSPIKKAAVLGTATTVGLLLIAVAAEALNYLQKYLSTPTAIIVLAVATGLMASFASYLHDKL